MLTAQMVFHVQIVRTTRENDAGIGIWGGEKGVGGRGNGGFENIYKLKVMRGGRSTPFVCPCRRGIIILHSAGSR